MTAYIKLSTLEYPRHMGDIDIDTDKDYAEVQWVDAPIYDTKNQTCYEGNPVEVDGIWHMTWLTRDLTQDEIDFANKPIDERFPK